MLLAWCSTVFALNPALDVSQYVHTSWRIRDGFPKGLITSIAQTPDGYLWLGTEFGLVRFDGVRNVPWQPPWNQHLPSTRIMSLLVAHDGTLWIGTQNGLASWKDSKLTQYPQLYAHYIFKIIEDHQGSVWATGIPIAISTGRLCEFRNGGAQCYGEDGVFGRGALNLYEDSKGELWAGVVDGFWRWKPGPPKFYPLPTEPDGIQFLGEDNYGALLVGSQGGIRRLVNGKTEFYPLPGSVEQFRARRFLRDRDGGIWIGTFDRGVVHVHEDRTDLFSSSDSLSADNVLSLFEDREGNIWVATSSGLDRFRDSAVATLTDKQGLLNSTVVSVQADRDGSVWLSTRGGLNKWTNGKITTINQRSAAATGIAPPLTRTDKPGQKLTDLPQSLFQDDSGRIWYSTITGFGYLENNRFKYVSRLQSGPVNAVTQDTAGNLWVSNEPVALFQLLRGTLVQQIPWPRLGHNSYASALAADRSRGGIWIGFGTGGIGYFTDNQIHESYAAADGLGEGRVNYLLFDRDGVLWAATDGGLSRIKDGRVVTLTGKNALPCDTVHWVMDDDDHSFWMYTACGLLRITSAELDAAIAAVDQHKDAKPSIQVTIFDSSDGVKILASGGHFGGQVTKSTDGKLWFLPWDGASIVDPRHLPFNNLPPPVHIEQIIADRKTYDLTSDSNHGVHLAPLTRDLQIDYTALSFVAPEKILFRYKLEGKDRDWQDAGNRRQAFYNDLPPGNYRFRVMACNNSGVWNEVGTYFDFSIDPAYYQTTWFRVLVVAAFLVLLGLLYQLRVQQVARQVRVRMEERLDERERIARDLHDTLLQSTQGLILKIHAVAKQIPREAAAHDALEKVLDRADQVLAEGRDRVRNLRDTTISLSDLPAAFKRVAEETPNDPQATFKTVVEGRPRELHPLVLEESYRIGREALINALKHSGGRIVEVEITYEPRQFRLRVRDDGRGIDPRILEEGGRADHWGMQGMRERANRIGAELKIWSGHQNGTEVEVIVPSGTAYKSANVKPRSRWFRKQI